MQNLIKFGSTGACRQYGEMYIVHLAYFSFICCTGNFLGASTEKKQLNHFKHLMA